MVASGESSYDHRHPVVLRSLDLRCDRRPSVPLARHMAHASDSPKLRYGNTRPRGSGGRCAPHSDSLPLDGRCSTEALWRIHPFALGRPLEAAGLEAHPQHRRARVAVEARGAQSPDGSLARASEVRLAKGSDGGDLQCGERGGHIMRAMQFVQGAPPTSLVNATVTQCGIHSMKGASNFDPMSTNVLFVFLPREASLRFSMSL